jgi:hypothetical protein
VDSQKAERPNDEIEASFSIPLPKLFKIEIHFKRKRHVYVENIKSGEAKVIRSNNEWLILFYDNKAEKLRYALMDKGKLKEVGELGG